MLIRLKVALACVVLATSTVSAQQEMPTRAAAAATKQTAKATGQRARDIRSLINGVAVDGNRMPLPNASVRLRSLDRNEIEQVVVTNELGEFTFVARPDVPYVVEIADQAGRTIAVGDVIVPRTGEVAGAVVSVPSHLRALATVFRDTASSVISAATRAGLAVEDPTLPKLSPTQ